MHACVYVHVCMCVRTCTSMPNGIFIGNNKLLLAYCFWCRVEENAAVGGSCGRELMGGGRGGEMASQATCQQS